jgi:hypothetical protein
MFACIHNQHCPAWPERQVTSEPHAETCMASGDMSHLNHMQRPAWPERQVTSEPHAETCMASGDMSHLNHMQRPAWPVETGHI